MFTITEKDSGRTRYGVCLNFYRTFEKRGPASPTSATVSKASSLESASGTENVTEEGANEKLNGAGGYKHSGNETQMIGGRENNEVFICFLLFFLSRYKVFALFSA